MSTGKTEHAAGPISRHRWRYGPAGALQLGPIPAVIIAAMAPDAGEGVADAARRARLAVDDDLLGGIGAVVLGPRGNGLFNVRGGRRCRTRRW